MPDLTHLNALELGLFRERQYLVREKTDAARALRRVWVAQAEREIADERKFLGLPATLDEILVSDDELLSELTT